MVVLICFGNAELNGDDIQKQYVVCAHACARVIGAQVVAGVEVQFISACLQLAAFYQWLIGSAIRIGDPAGHEITFAVQIDFKRCRWFAKARIEYVGRESRHNIARVVSAQD